MNSEKIFIKHFERFFKKCFLKYPYMSNGVNTKISFHHIDYKIQGSIYLIPKGEFNRLLEPFNYLVKVFSARTDNPYIEVYYNHKALRTPLSSLCLDDIKKFSECVVLHEYGHIFFQNAFNHFKSNLRFWKRDALKNIPNLIIDGVNQAVYEMLAELFVLSHCSSIELANRMRLEDLRKACHLGLSAFEDYEIYLPFLSERWKTVRTICSQAGYPSEALSSIRASLSNLSDIAKSVSKLKEHDRSVKRKEREEVLSRMLDLIITANRGIKN